MLSKIALVVSLFFGALALTTSTLAFAGPPFTHSPAHPGIQTRDFGVHHISTIPANAGEDVQIAVRELVKKNDRHARYGRYRRGSRSSEPVLFVHGASVPGVAAFDFDYKNYSWARYLAGAGFDVFIMDLSGYGFSPRPKMTNPCNTSESDQKNSLIPNPLAAVCEPDYPFILSNTEAERSEIDAVVDYIRAQRNAPKVTLIGWSLGGLRIGTYASLNPDKVGKLVFDASCCYMSDGTSDAPTPIPDSGVPIQTQTYSALISDRWLSNSCASEVADDAPQAAWNQIMRYDPLGSTWGTPSWNPISSPHGGVMRYPSWQIWGWNRDAAQRIGVPTLIIVGQNDGLYSTNQSLYSDLGASNKVFVGMECATHFSVWERQHTVLQKASLEWLLTNSVEGVKQGVFYADAKGRLHKQHNQ